MAGIITQALRRGLVVPAPLPPPCGVASGLDLYAASRERVPAGSAPSWHTLEDFGSGWDSGWLADTSYWLRQTGLPTHNGDAACFQGDNADRNMEKAFTHGIGSDFHFQWYATDLNYYPYLWLFQFAWQDPAHCYGVEIHPDGGGNWHIRVGQCSGSVYLTSYNDAAVTLSYSTVYTVDVHWDTVNLIGASVNGVGASYIPTLGYTSKDYIAFYQNMGSYPGGKSLYADYVQAYY